MGGRTDFLKSYLGGFVRDLSKNPDVVAKDISGMLVLTPFLGGDYYFLQGEIGWAPNARAGAAERFAEVRVPRGFVTDLASIPRLLWPIQSWPRSSEQFSRFLK